MVTGFIVIGFLALAGAALLGVVLHSRRFGWSAVGAIAGIVVFIVAASHFWHETVLGLAIASLVFLALGVMLQKVTPAKALVGALTALVLFFVFTWLAVQLADTFFFDKESTLQRWLEVNWPSSSDSDFAFRPSPWVPFAVGIACLAASAFLPRYPRAVLVFIALVLLLLQLPYYFPVTGWAGQIESLAHEPAIQAAVIVAIVILVMRALPGGEARRDHDPRN